MCGIVGLHGPQEADWIQGMNALQFHRGPDDSGVFRDEARQLSLAMRRLSILDLAGGHQPMSTADGRFTIVFNGEIYNAPALRTALEARGVKFVTDHSDTEVLLQSYAMDGVAMLPRLNGMFAFAIHDRDRGTLFCARDRFGIKPFHYFRGQGRFAFASELKSLLALPCIPRRLDRQSLFHYMSLMYVPGRHTIVEGVDRLPAGHALTYRLSDGHVSVERWWQPRVGHDPDAGRGNLEARLREEIRQAVLRWTLADVPIACSLSGGLDSSTIVAILAQSGARVSTYSLGFRGEGEDSWNELPLARLVAQRWGTDHHELVLDPEVMLDELLLMAWHLDEPYGGGLPSWAVFKDMSRDVKVGLTGTGGDELFGNYGKWRRLERRFLPGLFRRKVDRELFRTHFFDQRYYFPDADKPRYLAPNDGFVATRDLLFECYGDDEPDPRDGIARMDIGTQLPEEFLMMTDRFSMAHSLEARTPFLDHELAQFVLSIPAHIRTRRRDPKHLLRAAMAADIPREILEAPKRGFVIPLKLWLRQRLRPVVEHLLSPARLRDQGVFRPEFYADIVLPHLEGRADHTDKVWAAFMFQLWHHLFLERGTVARPDHDLRALLQ